ATAVRLAQAGSRAVIVNYKTDVCSANEVAARCSAFGSSAVAYKCDVSRLASVERVVTMAVDKVGSLDILVANPGIWKRAPIERMTEQQWRETIQINLDSIFACCREAARIMVRQKRGTIILVSSTAGQRGESFHSHYAATKGAVIAMTKSLAAELG